eukprot:scaffold10429_cov126-Cylindrotheca_fusiformis.AAC.9
MAVSVSQGNEDQRRSSNNAIVLDLYTIKSYLAAILSQVQSRVTVDTIRPLPMFLGVTDNAFCFSPAAFTPPVKKLDKASTEKLKSRIKLNFSFFLSNYALVAFGVALVVALMHPGMIAFLAGLWGLWGVHTFLISNEVIVMGRNIGNLISISHRSSALALITFVVIVWKCLWPAITVVTLSSLLILSHALMRDPKHIDTSNSSGNRDDDDDSTGGYASGGSEVLVDRPVV